MEKPRYDLRCVVDPSKVCPAKRDIMREATGDATGCTPIDSEATERLVQIKFAEQNIVGKAADLVGRHGDITDICPVRPAMNDNAVRRGVLSMIRHGIRRYSSGQTS